MGRGLPQDSVFVAKHNTKILVLNRLEVIFHPAVLAVQLRHKLNAWCVPIASWPRDGHYFVEKTMKFRKCFLFAFFLALATLSLGSLPAFADGWTSTAGGATSYGVLFTGAGANTLQVTNVTVNGNVGVGGTGLMTDSGPSTINGAVNFFASNTGQFSNNNVSDVITGGVNYGVSSVNTLLSTLESLNTTLGAEAGTAVGIGTGAGQTLSINAGSGTLDANGNRVFTVTSFNTTNGNKLIINGSATDFVVLNFSSSVNFNNQVQLTGGITPDHILYNFVGGSGLTGGPTLQINDNLSTNTPNCTLGVYCVQGYFLDPNGAVSVVNANVLGGVWGGDTHDFQYVSGANVQTFVSAPEPGSLVLLASGLLGFLLLGRPKLI
jgi:hypothetical protein